MIEMREPAFWTVTGDGAELVHFTLMKNLPEVYIWSHSGVKDDCRESSLVARKSYLKVKWSEVDWELNWVPFISW